MDTPAFFYFDLGNVLLRFDHERGMRQMSDVSGVPLEQIRRFLVDEGRQEAYEAGAIDSDQLFEEFCNATGTTPSRPELLRAAGDIFEPIEETVEIARALHAAGLPLGLLSNTCDCHWQTCVDGRYPFLQELFRHVVLSFEERAVKPQSEIYAAAAKRAGIEAPQIFFVDDMPQHVAGAKKFGIDAVQFKGAADLRVQLRRRGIRI